MAPNPKSPASGPTDTRIRTAQSAVCRPPLRQPARYIRAQRGIWEAGGGSRGTPLLFNGAALPPLLFFYFVVGEIDFVGGIRLSLILTITLMVTRGSSMISTSMDSSGSVTAPMISRVRITTPRTLLMMLQIVFKEKLIAAQPHSV